MVILSLKHGWIRVNRGREEIDWEKVEAGGGVCMLYYAENGLFSITPLYAQTGSRINSSL